VTYDQNEPHPRIEEYLRALKKKLRFMAKRTKHNILDEVRSHLHESAVDLGGLNKKNIMVAIANYGAPKDIAKRYKRLYGYGKFITVLFAVFGFILGILTVPILIPAFNKELTTINTVCLFSNTFFIILLFFLIILSGVKFGRWTGLLMGLAALVSRGLSVVIMTTLLSRPENLEAVTSEGPCFIYIIVSIMMPVAGFIAGRVFIKFREKSQDVEWN